MQLRWLGWTLWMGAVGCVDPFPSVVAPLDTPRDMSRFDALHDRGIVDAGARDQTLSDGLLPDQLRPDQMVPDQRMPDEPGRAPMPGEVVINEIDYDQVSGDTAEFVELLNRSDAILDVRMVRLEFINGANGEIYQPWPGNADEPPDPPIFLGLAAMQPDQRIIFRSDTGAPAVAAGVTIIERPKRSGVEFMQNGNRDDGDGVRLILGDTVLDSLAYEGPNAAFGEGEPALDDSSDNGLSISRCADGEDTNDNRSDFRLTAHTPGATNNCEPLPDPGQD